MEVRILGPLELVHDGAALPLPGGRARALLALLSLRVGEVVSSDRLIDELWGEAPPATARTKLHGLVSALRKSFSGVRVRPATELLTTRSPGYLLALEPDGVDAHRFRRLVAAARDSPPAARAAALQRALGLWRGAALADFAYQPFAQSEIATLEELRLLALEERLDAELVLGRHREVVADIEQLVDEHPFRERLWAQRLLALYRCGRRAEALDAYQRLQRLLAEAFEVEPGAELQQLRRSIVEKDPSLAPPVAPPPLPSSGAQSDTVDAWLAQSRKPVTVMFAEIARAAAAEIVDPEVVQRVLERAYQVATKVLGRHGGTVEGVLGGVVVAVFGVPVVREDDAARAARAALELVAALAGPRGEPQLGPGGGVTARVGIHSGEVVVGGAGLGSTAAYGGTVAVASELQRTAAAGEILVGDATMRLLTRAAEVEAVEIAALELGVDRIDAWTLRALSPAAAAGSHDEGELVGRSAELERLSQALGRAVDRRRAERITVIGEAGIGKSRLARGFTAALAGVRVVTGHCPVYGEGITFWPLREIVMQAAGSAERSALVELFAGDPRAETIADRIGAVTGLAAESAPATELFPAVRSLFERLARDRPLVAIFEDVHWAEPTLLDLIDYLVVALHHSVLLLLVARPDFLERWPERGGNAHARLGLGPLDTQASAELVAARLGRRPLPQEKIRQAIELAAGNPLFLEQMVAALRSDGAELPLPPSLQAFLTARLERLGPAERDVLRCAAVIGRSFSQRALTSLVPAAVHPFLERHLQSLCDRELLDLRGRTGAGESDYSFRHALIRLAAYRSITHRTRAELHERLADWLTETEDRTAREFEELIGYHLEQAWEHRREIDLLDPHSASLAERAGGHLAAAGARAFARLDIAATVGLLTRAKTLLPPEHPQRRATLQRLAQAAQIDGRHADADSALTELLEGVDPAGETSLTQRLRVERSRIQLFTGPDPVPLQSIEREAERALEVFGELEDHTGVSQAADVLCQVHLRRGQLRRMEQTARLGLDHAHRSGHPRQVIAARAWLAEALLSGPRPVPSCLDMCAPLLRWQGIDHPLVLTVLARLRAMLGEGEQARRLVARGRWICLERYHARRPLMFVAVAAAEVEMLLGDPDAAETELRTALATAGEMKEAEVVARTAAALSRLLPPASAETRRLVALAGECAPAECVHAQAAWRAARSRLLVERGAVEAAERLAREAVASISEEMPNLRADHLVELATLLDEAGRTEPARAARSEALELYDRKGNLVAAARTAALGG